MPFEVYKNRIGRRAAIHWFDCGNVKKHGGVSQKIPPTGEWFGPFSSLASAEEEASKRLPYAYGTKWRVQYAGCCDVASLE